MSIKPVLVPDQDAKTLRALLETFDAAATGPVKQQLTESAESENLAIGEKMARDGIEYDPAREGEIISMIGDYLRRDGMTTRQVRGYMMDNDFISDQLSYLPRKSGVAEAAAENNPVVNAITRRIMLQRTDLLSKYGPELVGQAIDEVADFVGDVEEIGSSDVSGWVRHVEQMLGNREPDVTEQATPAFKPGDRVMYLNGFATVVAQDGDAYGIRVDGKPGTQMVPADQIRKPSYDESVAESIDPVEQLRADIRRFAL